MVVGLCIMTSTSAIHLRLLIARLPSSGSARRHLCLIVASSCLLLRTTVLLLLSSQCPPLHYIIALTASYR